MSAISSIAGAAQQAVEATSSASSAERNPFAEVSSEQWLGIILEELSNQDPFEPNDTTATLEQLNSLRSIESDISLQGQLEALVLQNSIGQAGSLIGKEIDGLSRIGQEVTGIVESVRIVDGVSQLQLESGSSVTFDNVLNVRQAAEADAQAAAATPTANAPAGLVPGGVTTPNVDDVLAGLVSELSSLTGGVAVVDEPEPRL
jgi:flagellar basal-body rod modification protein FlgD